MPSKPKATVPNGTERRAAEEEPGQGAAVPGPAAKEEGCPAHPQRARRKRRHEPGGAGSVARERIERVHPFFCEGLVFSCSGAAERLVALLGSR